MVIWVWFDCVSELPVCFDNCSGICLELLLFVLNLCFGI